MGLVVHNGSECRTFGDLNRWHFTVDGYCVSDAAYVHIEIDAQVAATGTGSF